MIRPPYSHEGSTGAAGAEKKEKASFRSRNGIPLKQELSQRLVLEPLTRAGVALSCVFGVTG